MQYQRKSVRTPKFFLSSSMLLVPWMAPTSIAPQQLQNARQLETGKDMSHRTAWQHAHLTSNSYMFTVGGRAMYNDARLGDLYIPSGKYLLADAGFPMCRELLVLYRGAHYHLADTAGEAGFCRLQNPLKTHCSMFKFSLTFCKQQNSNFQ